MEQTLVPSCRTRISGFFSQMFKDGPWKDKKRSVEVGKSSSFKERCVAKWSFITRMVGSFSPKMAAAKSLKRRFVSSHPGASKNLQCVYKLL